MQPALIKRCNNKNQLIQTRELQNNGFKPLTTIKWEKMQVLWSKGLNISHLLN